MTYDGHGLWGDVGILTDRHGKASAVVDAVARLLQRDSDKLEPAARFADAYQQYLELSGTTRETLAAEPYTYYWARLAYELLQPVLDPRREPSGLAAHHCQQHAVGPGEALPRHLSEFSRLLLAGAVLEGKDMRLQEPLEVRCPFALPATAISVEGADGAVISGVSSGGLEVSPRDPGETATEVVYPQLDFRDCHIRLQPAVFNVTASGVPEDIIARDVQSQVEDREHISDALSVLLEINDAAFHQLCVGIRVIATRARGEPGGLTNVSHCDLPGAIAVYANRHPHELANTIYHEFLHNRLFALEEKGLFLDPSTGEGARVYSPWRSDYRPAHGLLHAVYVFTGVGRYWLDVIRCGSTPPSIVELAKTRVLRGLYQVQIGFVELRRRAVFTEAGQALMAQLERDHTDLGRQARDAGIRSDLPVLAFQSGDKFGVRAVEDTAKSSVLRHLHKYAKADHARELESQLVAV